METAVSFASGAIIYIIGLIINVKLWMTTKQEGRRRGGHLTERITLSYTIIQIVLWPIFLVLSWTFNYGIVLPVADVWICLAHNFFIRFFRLYVSFHSLVVATMRYSFTIHEAKIILYGKEKANNVFLYLSLLFPLMTTILHEATTAEHQGPPLDRCLILYDHLEGHRHYWWSHANHSDVFMPNATKSLVHQPLYKLFGENFPSELVMIVRAISVFAIVLMLANIVEGFLYWRIFRHIRYGTKYFNNIIQITTFLNA